MITRRAFLQGSAAVVAIAAVPVVIRPAFADTAESTVSSYRWAYDPLLGQNVMMIDPADEGMAL